LHGYNIIAPASIDFGFVSQFDPNFLSFPHLHPYDGFELEFVRDSEFSGHFGTQIRESLQIACQKLK